MFDLKKWSENSPKAAWISVIFASVLTLNGAVNGGLDIYEKISQLNKPINMLAFIERANFQSTTYDELDISFRNPTDKTQSINNLSIICQPYEGNAYTINTINNSPKKYALVKGLEHTPINIEENRSKTVTVAIFKSLNSPAISETCKTIAVLWGNTLFESQVGEKAKLDKNTVSMSSGLYKQS